MKVLKTLFIAAIVAIPATSYAAPTISVVRAPSVGYVGDTYSLTWKTSGAVDLGYDCSGAWNGKQTSGVPLNDTISGTYDSGMVGTTKCLWTAKGADGGVATYVETFQALLKEQTQEFKVTAINGQAYSGNPVGIPADSKSFRVEGVGAKGMNVFVRTEGKVYANVPANADGTWSITVENGTLGGAFVFPSSGVMQFIAETTKPYTASKTAYFSVNVQGNAADLSGMKCRSGAWSTETNFSAPYGTQVECVVSSNDPSTTLYMNSGYTSWGDVDSTKYVEPKTQSAVSTSCSQGSCVARFTSDYRGYSKHREVWFQNSSGKKSASVSYHSSDSSSEDYKKGEEYLRRKYGESSAGGSSSSSSSSSSNSSGNGTSSGGSSSSSSNGSSYSEATVSSVSGSAKWNPETRTVTAKTGAFFAIQGTAPAKHGVRLYREDLEAESISVTAGADGKWSMFNLGNSWYGRIFALGKRNYEIKISDESGGTVSTIRITIDLVDTVSSSSSSSTSSSSTSSSSTSSQTNGTSKANVSSNAYSTKISAALKTKLDSFVSTANTKAASMRTSSDSLKYLETLNAKLVKLAAKYRASKKLANVVAIRYLIVEIDALEKKYESTADETDILLKDLSETY